MTIYEKNLSFIREKIVSAAHRSGRSQDEITLIAVSKGQPSTAIKSALDAGQHTFGESYAQEFRDKIRELDTLSDIRWHFIGHLQTNKVKYVAPFAKMIHSVDSVRIAEEISKYAVKNERVVDVLIQINTSGEPSKSGCQPEEIFALSEIMTQQPGIRLAGLMTIPKEHENPENSRHEFQKLRELKEKLFTHLGGKIPLPHLSMGMSHDFEIAIEEGATLVRIGTAIFGERNY